MRFDAFRIPVAQAAIKSIIEKYSGTNAETALKIAGETEIEIGILNGVIDPNGVLCGGTAAVGAYAVMSFCRIQNINNLIKQFFASEKIRKIAVRNRFN